MLSPYAIRDFSINSIIFYPRRSRQDEEMEKRTGEDTLKAQIDLMDRVLIPLGIPYDIRPEIGSGDKISTRPVFQSVIEDLLLGKYQAIAVKEISRMGRGSYKDMGTIYDLIIEKRIYVITPWKVYDPKNPSDLKQIRFELFMSREEFETTRERLTGGRITSAMSGVWVSGKPPFGYDIDKKTRHLAINGDDAPIVRIIFDRFVNGVPDDDGKLISVMYRALATHLKRTGIRTPNDKVEWQPDNLKYLLTNPAYIGNTHQFTTVTINGKAVKLPPEEHVIRLNAHEPIIELVTWEKAQAKVNDRAYKPRVKVDFKPYELTGLPVCSQCGRKMVRQEQNQKYKESVYFKEFLICPTSSCTMVKYRAVEESLLDVLQLFSEMDERLVESVLKPLLTKDIASNKSTEDMKQYVERKKAELKLRMDFIYSKYESGKYSDEVFDERKAEVDLELAKLANISLVGVEVAAIEEIPIDSMEVKKKLTSVLSNYNKSEDRSDKNEILRKVFDKVIIEIVEKGRGSIPAKFNIYPRVRLDFVL